MQGDGLEGAVGVKDNFSTALTACVPEKGQLQVAVFLGNLFFSSAQGGEAQFNKSFLGNRIQGLIYTNDITWPFFLGTTTHGHTPMGLRIHINFGLCPFLVVKFWASEFNNAWHIV